MGGVLCFMHIGRVVCWTETVYGGVYVLRESGQRGWGEWARELRVGARGGGGWEYGTTPF